MFGKICDIFPASAMMVVLRLPRAAIPTSLSHRQTFSFSTRRQQIEEVTSLQLLYIERRMESKTRHDTKTYHGDDLCVFEGGTRNDETRRREMRRGNGNPREKSEERSMPTTTKTSTAKSARRQACLSSSHPTFSRARTVSVNLLASGTLTYLLVPRPPDIYKYFHCYF
jgi:hypothetical protein